VIGRRSFSTLCLAIPLAGLLAWPAAPARAQTTPQEPIQVEDLPDPTDTAPLPVLDQEPTTPREEAVPLEQEARREYAEGNLPRALLLYRELAEEAQAPAEEARLRITAAWLCFQLDDRAGALEQLGRALYAMPEAPFRPELYSPEFVALHQDALADALDRRRRTAARKTGLAVDAIRAHDYGAARTLLLEARELAPQDPEIQYDLAFVDLRQGRADEALAGFERVLALARSGGAGISRDLETRTLNSLALLYYGRSDFEAARATLEEAIELEPDDARAWFNLGLARERLGQRDESYAALRKARELDRRDPDIARALGLAEIDRKRWVEATSLLVAATEARPEDPELYLHLGRAQAGLGNAEGALESFRNARRLDPGNRLGVAVTASLLAAGMLRERENAAGAEQEARAAIDLDRGAVDAWILLGLAELDQGRAAEALEALETARRLAPERADAAQNVGSAKLELRDYAGAEEAFRRALELDPSNAEVQQVLAQIEARRAAEAAQAAPSRRKAPSLGAKLAAADYPPLGIRGLRVESVAAGGAAQRSGLAAGDLILRADGQPVVREADLLRRLGSRTVKLDVLRAGRPVEIKLRVE